MTGDSDVQTAPMPNRLGLEVSTAATAVPVVGGGQGNKAGAILAGTLVGLGSALCAVPFGLPWLGPLIGSVVMAVGAAIAAANGVTVTVPSHKQ